MMLMRRLMEMREQPPASPQSEEARSSGDAERLIGLEQRVRELTEEIEKLRSSQASQRPARAPALKGRAPPRRAGKKAQSERTKRK
jgi:hypothetical protein